ncbi:MAG: acyl-CoA desaturase [Rhodospirillaceae bacterium]|nr:acyl-CoA desaturase [Rhodospirillaceae bacterium]
MATALIPPFATPGRAFLVTAILGYHLVALLAVVPYFFSWAGVGLAVAGYAVALLGINIGYHRLLAHKGIACSKRVEHGLAVLGVLAAQFGPAYWVAIHRRHHHHVDDESDPHSPRTGMLWAHMGWLLAASDNTDPEAITRRYAKDLLRDPFYVRLEANGGWIWIVVASWVAVFAAGAVAALIAGGTAADAVQLGLSLAVWGIAVRTVWVWHVTWSVNSVSHVWGYRSHDTPDDSRNNPIVGILAFGEGWHNNHHAAPRSARHGRRWWELDLTWLAIKALAWIGLVTILDAGDRTASPAG